jgi:hypothetical protein
MHPGNSPFDNSDISMLFSGPPARIPRASDHNENRSIEMTTKKAKSKPAEPNYVLKPKQRAAADKALSRVRANTAPRLKLVNNEVSIDHPNAMVGELLMMEALGTGDQNFAEGLVSQLAGASGSPGRAIDEANLNFMLAVVVTAKPIDEVDAMIGAQMAVIQSAAMKAAQRLARADNLLEFESAERTFNRLMRSFAALVSCRSPAVRSKKRCRMHGGAAGSGAPEKNKNALRHGLFTKEAIEERNHVRALISQTRKLLQDIE